MHSGNSGIATLIGLTLIPAAGLCAGGGQAGSAHQNPNQNSVPHVIQGPGGQTAIKDPNTGKTLVINPGPRPGGGAPPRSPDSPGSSAMCEKLSNEIRIACSSGVIQTISSASAATRMCRPCGAILPLAVGGAAETEGLSLLGLLACAGCPEALAKLGGGVSSCMDAIRKYNGPCNLCANANDGQFVCETYSGKQTGVWAQCQNRAPKFVSRCRVREFCDPNAPNIKPGTLNPTICGDCDNDGGQAPNSSYRAGEGYCMRGGRAPGWHQCVGAPAEGYRWVYLPKLGSAHGCPVPR
jgi:hypothetical protein